MQTMKKSIHCYRVFFVYLILAFMLTGCVTEVSNSVFQKKDPEEAANISIKAGMEYLRAGQYERAQYHMSRALKLNPKSAKAHGSMALLYNVTGEVQLEERHYKKALSNDKDYVAARNNYGAFLYREGRYEEALKQLQKAATYTSYENRSATFVNLGRCAIQLNEFELAERAFKKASRLNNALPAPYLELADLYYLQEKFVEADRSMKAFGEAARHTPRSLWLGIRIAQLVNDKDAEASHVLALKNLYPDSREFTLYKKYMTEKSNSVR